MNMSVVTVPLQRMSRLLSRCFYAEIESEVELVPQTRETAKECITSRKEMREKKKIVC